MKTALRWPDGRVSAFDESGREIAELVGDYDRLRDKILERSTSKTVLRRLVYAGVRVETVSREEW